MHPYQPLVDMLPGVATGRLTSSDLMTAYGRISAEARCLRPCAGCPFAYKLEGISFFDDDRWQAVKYRIEHLGGFPCHHYDGNHKAFEGRGEARNAGNETHHVCQGWLRAGGDLAAFARRFKPTLMLPPPPPEDDLEKCYGTSMDVAMTNIKQRAA